jgi:hypothetical protein
MRSFQVFAAMSPEESESFFSKIKESSPTLFAQSVHAASAALKSRPAFMMKQPFAKQVSAVRRALSRVAANPLADETLAMYFLEVRKELLVEWLDTAGVSHEDGALTEDSPAEPEREALEQSVEKFRTAGADADPDADTDPDREILLRAFAAQTAIEWPALEALIEAKTKAG